VVLDRVALDGAAAQALAPTADDVGKALRIVPERSLALLPVVHTFPGRDWDEPPRRQHQLALASFAGDRLVLGAEVTHPGALLRALPLDASRLVALSHEALQVIDAADLQAPAVVGRLELARLAVDVAVDGGRAVAVTIEPESETPTFSVLSYDTLDPSAPLASLPLVSAAARVFLRGTMATVLSVRTDTGGGPNVAIDVLDISDPARVVRRGRLLTSAFFGANAFEGHQFVEHGLARFVDLGGGFYAFASAAFTSDDQGEVSLIDVRDPDRPVVAGRAAFPGARGMALTPADGGTLLVVSTTYRQDRDGFEIPTTWFDLLDVTDPASPRRLPGASVPGGVNVLAAGSGAVVSGDTGASPMLRILRLSPRGVEPLPPMAIGPNNVSAVVDGAEVALLIGGRLEALDLASGARTQARLPFATVDNPAEQIAVGLAGGRLLLWGGEVYSVRAPGPQFAGLLPFNRAQERTIVFHIERDAAAGRPVRAYYADGIHGISSFPVE
jgi:hypothetical protein